MLSECFAWGQEIDYVWGGGWWVGIRTTDYTQIRK